MLKVMGARIPPWEWGWFMLTVFLLLLRMTNHPLT